MILWLSLAFASTVVLSGCSSPEQVEVGADTVIIDVRTPAEFASGHLDGAINIDLESGDFAAEVSELATTGEYIVYCRSGNRSAQAAELMAGQGFKNVTDLGSAEDASAATGQEIVQ